MSPRGPAEQHCATVRRRPPHEDQIEFGPQAGKRVGDRLCSEIRNGGPVQPRSTFSGDSSRPVAGVPASQVRGQFAAPAADVEDRRANASPRAEHARKDPPRDSRLIEKMLIRRQPVPRIHVLRPRCRPALTRRIEGEENISAPIPGNGDPAKSPNVASGVVLRVGGRAPRCRVPRCRRKINVLAPCGFRAPGPRPLHLGLELVGDSSSSSRSSPAGTRGARRGVKHRERPGDHHVGPFPPEHGARRDGSYAAEICRVPSGRPDR